MDIKIFRQSFYLLFAQAITKVIAFIYTFFLAKSLGVETFGLYVTALAYFALVSSISDFGFNRFLIREGSRNQQQLPNYICSTIILRLSLTSLIFALFAVWLYLFDRNALRVSLSLLAVLATLPQSIALTFDAVLIIKQKLNYSALSLFCLSLFNTVLGFYLVSNHFGAFGAVAALVFGQLGYVFILLWFIFKEKTHFFSNVTLAQLKEIAKGSLPYGILGMLGLFYFRIDTVMLSYLKGAEQTGIYGAAYKELEAVIFIPSAISAVIFPQFAKLHDQNSVEVKKLYFLSMKSLALISIPVVAGCLIIFPIFIRNFLPAYLLSIQAIQILSLAIPFIFLNTPAVQLLFSSNRYLKLVIGLSVVTLSFNIIANLIFIPVYGFIGASWVTVASEVVSFLMFFLFVNLKFLK